jgi:hypothetical protein
VLEVHPSWPPQTETINGAEFLSSSTVTYNGAQLAATYSTLTFGPTLAELTKTTNCGDAAEACQRHHILDDLYEWQLRISAEHQNTSLRVRVLRFLNPAFSEWF